jgi:hypothetical protein
MKKPITRSLSVGALRHLNLSIPEPDTPAPVTDCEVVEWDGEAGWQRWQDSLFVQDFEDSVLSAPSPLFPDLKASR